MSQILLLQSVIYYQGYKKLVLYLFLVETVGTGICVVMIYEPLVGQFGTTSPMLLFPTLMPVQPFLEIAISVPVQIFYSWRIYIILGSYIPPALICLTSLVSMAGACWTGISVIQAHSYINKHLVDHGALTWSISAAVSDMIITISLFSSLTRSKSGNKTTDDAINRIVRTAIQTWGVGPLHRTA
ncbi:hypothetical protein B0H11DRAFT_2215520 [Mycena galericulata]|nr:hypothetical protein B0H11DRAFT_2215520 [Mycena galericulata]